MDDKVDGEFVGIRKSNKRGGKHASSSKLRHHGNSGRAVMAPPSFLKSQQNPSKASRHHDNYSTGLWEWYYDDEEGGGDDQFRNIRGFLMKRRKSPLKGYQKRYFVLEKGCLYFSRSYTQMTKGKVTGMLDLGLAFIHYDGASKRIDIDGETHVLHLKMKNASQFAAWSSALLTHEEHRKSQVAEGKLLDTKAMSMDGAATSRIRPSSLVGGAGISQWVDKTRRTIASIKKDMEGIHEGLESMSAFIRSSPRDSVIISASAHNINTSTEKLPVVSDTVVPETVSLPSFEPTARQDSNGMLGSGTAGVTASISGIPATTSTTSTTSKKKFAIRKHKKDKKKDTSINMTPEQAAAVVQAGSSGGSANIVEESPLQVGGAITDAGMGRDDFTAVAKLVYAQFCELIDRLEKLDFGLSQAADQHTTSVMRRESQLSNQLHLLRQTMSQNSDLRDRLSQIQSLSNGESKVMFSTPVGGQSVRTGSSAYHRSAGGSISRFDSFMSLQSTMSEKFFDAVEQVHDTSSEDEGEISDLDEEEESDEGSDGDLYSSLSQDVFSKLDTSSSRRGPDGGILEEEDETPEFSSHDVTPDRQIPASTYAELQAGSHQVGAVSQGQVRRAILPAPVSEMADFSLWSLLRKNIGKDLSKISMPVSMNEPLSALQRLCEELEYSSLLDEASDLVDPFDRMVRVACFAVSSYATSVYRAGKKPFNPILGETYECIREDRKFNFIAEQVSHHPPVAACHCSSPNFEFWQDARIKSKFWGKSMEVFPIGVVNVTLPKHGDHYQWQKVTSCIHNVFGGQRWVDQYGEMTITNNDQCTCKLTFVKASYWSSKKYIVHGDVYDRDNVPVRHVFGTWNDAMFCKDGEDTHCIWKAAEMPPDSERYYGFSIFAIQLNELLENQRNQLPCTDCRFRSDQRMLENGEVQEADAEKRRVEQIQREARAERERFGVDWSPNFFRKVIDDNQEKWISNESYWTHRDKHFSDIQLPTLW